MNLKKEFDVLEDTGQSVIDRLASEFPPADESEKERIFSMSEGKFNKHFSELPEDGENTVSGVEVYKRPVWQRIVSTAAAAVLIAGGITGGAFAMKRFRSAANVASDAGAEDTAQQDQKKIAPFGDFAELEYQLCDLSDEGRQDIINRIQNDTLSQVLIDETEEIKSYFGLVGGKEISADKREKLAEFFNNYDYSDSQFEFNDEDGTPYIGSIATVTFEPQDSLSAVDDSKITPESLSKYSSFKFFNEEESDCKYCFCWQSDDEVRYLGFYTLKDGTGIINYTHFHYAEKYGQLVMTDDKISVEGWKVDYDLFTSTIEDILADDTEETEETTAYTPASDISFTDERFFTENNWGYCVDGQNQDYTQMDIAAICTRPDGSEGMSNMAEILYNNSLSDEQAKEIAAILSECEWRRCEESDKYPMVPNENSVQFTAKTTDSYLSMIIAYNEQPFAMFSSVRFTESNGKYYESYSGVPYAFLEESLIYFCSDPDIVQKISAVLS
ncbi:MAG: hypothetical protein J6X56_03855 [Ruminococcus sp.]|uniref:hypothetical protein n=1 Tax=Ruminococcus sp. TaxID=41978 RepID=UPI001B5D4589|nr:hypothetical protein [Ruminococcus sp.]MBP5578607.1 hypothetical protein [Ruminococcus sp.]